MFVFVATRRGGVRGRCPFGSSLASDPSWPPGPRWRSTCRGHRRLRLIICVLSVTVMVVAVVSVVMMVCGGQIFVLGLWVMILVVPMCVTVIVVVLCGLRSGWSGRSGVAASRGSLFCVWRVVVVVVVRVVGLVVVMIMTVSFIGG